jgi:hypothetical protein
MQWCGLDSFAITAALCACSAMGCSFLAPVDDYDRGSVGTGGAGGTSSTSSGGAGGDCGSFDHPGTSSLVDRFEDGVPGSAWMTLGGCPPLETGGQVIFAPPANAMDFCWYASTDVFHLTCDTLTVKVTDVTASVLGVQTFIYLVPTDGLIPLNLLLEAGSFRLAPDEGPGEIAIPQPYDPVADVWWRLRESQGTLYFETSPDGLAWVVRGSGASPIPLDALQIRFGAGTYQLVGAPGEAHFACYNAPAPCP